MTPEQARAARVILRWKVTDAAQEAGVSPNTIVRLEARSKTNHSAAAVQRAYEKAGVELVERNDGGPGVRLTDGDE